MSNLLRSIVIACLTACLNPVTIPALQQRDRLSEDHERSSNEVQPPRAVMDVLGIGPGTVIGEVGAGVGRLTVHVADRVGEKGRVCANDIDAEALGYLKERCRRLQLSNVEIVSGSEEDARLPVNTLDAVMMAWVYHHAGQKVALLRSLLPSLKPWGFVAMVEPTPVNTEAGLPPVTRESVAAGTPCAEAGRRARPVQEFRVRRVPRSRGLRRLERRTRSTCPARGAQALRRRGPGAVPD
jgi:SAM-dependent methyltransferase